MAYHTELRNRSTSCSLRVFEIDQSCAAEFVDKNVSVTEISMDPSCLVHYLYHFLEASAVVQQDYQILRGTLTDVVQSLEDDT